jgi:Mannosyltransferase (PIG-V)
MAGVSDTLVAVPSAPEPAPKAGLRALLASMRYPLTVFAVSRVGVYALLAAAGWTSRVPRESGLSYHGLFAPLGQWDAVWYGWIAQHGYDPAIGHGNAAAFFPLYPLAWRVVSVLPGPMSLWGSLLSSALFAGALCLLYAVTRGRDDERLARRTVLYLAIFPLTFVFALPYAESLFLLLTLGAFALTWHGRWWSASAVGALAVLARPVGIALVPALAWRRYRTEGLRWRAYLPLLLMPAAEIAFFLYLGWRTGNFMANPDAQERGWGRGVSILPWVVVHTLWHDVIEGGHLRFLIHIGFTLLWCGLFYKAWRMRMPGEYLIFAALAVLLPTSGGLLVSMGRFGMVAFPLFWALASWGEDERVDTFVKTSFPLLLGALVMITYTARTFTP